MSSVFSLVIYKNVEWGGVVDIALEQPTCSLAYILLFDFSAMLWSLLSAFCFSY